MPSAARLALTNNLKDIDGLLELHVLKGGLKRGRRFGLEVVNKSAVVLLTAFWEAYCEDLAAEALEFLVKATKSADALPIGLRQQVAKDIKAHPNEIEPWRLAGEGWREYLAVRLGDLRKKRNWDLMTPKSDNIDKLFQSVMGIERMSGNWSFSRLPAENVRKRLDDFVSLRGNIAHRGRHSKSVKKAEVEEYRKLITRLAARTGGVVNRTVRKATGKFMW